MNPIFFLVALLTSLGIGQMLIEVGHISKPPVFVELKEKYSGWQGVATDGKKIYVTTDRPADFDETHKLKNKISVYSMEGELVSVLPDAYSKTDPSGSVMSFGDGSVINGALYVPVYNINGIAKRGGDITKNTVSRIVKYSLTDLKFIEEYEIGDGTAESIAEKDGYFWVVYHDRNEIRKFDRDFKLVKSYPLSQKFEEEGGYQGVFFEGDEVFTNLHGSNEFGQKYAQGLDHYHFDGEYFTFIERILPPVYGAGQGIEANGNKYYWADRPGNRIVITYSLKKSDKF